LKSSLNDAVTRSGEEQGIRWANLLIMSVLFNASLFCEKGGGREKERRRVSERVKMRVCERVSLSEKDSEIECEIECLRVYEKEHEKVNGRKR
jgi:hypothetical protein